jgi:hypothetical protein
MSVFERQSRSAEKAVFPEQTRRSPVISSTPLKFINDSYANYINRKRNRSGHLLRGRYKGILGYRDASILELSRYLHLNPVRARIAGRPEDYGQSSYGSYVEGKRDAMVTTDLLLRMVSVLSSRSGIRGRPLHFYIYKNFEV